MFHQLEFLTKTDKVGKLRIKKKEDIRFSRQWYEHWRKVVLKAEVEGKENYYIFVSISLYHKSSLYNIFEIH